MADYGAEPVDVGRYDVRIPEMMHYLYLPVRWPYRNLPGTGVRLPSNLRWVWPLLFAVLESGEVGPGDYLYVTARRGYATPDNPINRPGYHTDGFGTDDTNWVWCDRWGTRLACHPFEGISDDHAESMAQFEAQARCTQIADPGRLWRYDPFVVHNTPEIPAPGGERCFVKISRSPHRYNLEGNSHNYEFDYDWTMHRRSVMRNDPAQLGRDFWVDEP